MTLLAAVALFCSFQCGDGQVELPELEITSDVSVITADGRSRVTFSLYEGKADVTSSAVFYDATGGKRLEGNTFATDTPGEYSFYAEYQGRRSEMLDVLAEPVIESKYVRNICLMEFTDGSCSFCPDASRYIDRNILGKNENVHLMAFHEKDQWKSEQFATLFSKFNLLGTPAASVDMRGGLSLESGERDKLKDAIQESETEYPSHCGVAVSSTVDAQGTANISVKLCSEKNTDYYMAVYIVEDGVKGYQLDGSIEYDDYYHQFVVRKMLSATVYGDGMGRLASGNEKSKEYVVACGKDWNLAKTYVYALALDSDGFVNNMQVCPIDGGNSDYECLK